MTSDTPSDTSDVAVVADVAPDAAPDPTEDTEPASDVGEPEVVEDVSVGQGAVLLNEMWLGTTRGSPTMTGRRRTGSSSTTRAMAQ